MKKIAIFIVITIISISTISYMYLNYIANFRNVQKENLDFEVYKDKEIYGTDLATIINRAIDNNKNNEISIDNKGKYVDNANNSINIEIKMLDDDGTIYNMEKIYSGGTNVFVQYYGKIKFKCIEFKYHQKTNKVKYMLFEQITQ